MNQDARLIIASTRSQDGLFEGTVLNCYTDGFKSGTDYIANDFLLNLRVSRTKIESLK